MKKLVINIILIVATFIIYILQANFFNWFNISGIMPNLFVILILFIGLFSTRIMGTVYGVVVGIILDLVIGTNVGFNAFSLGLIGFVGAFLDKNFSKDSRMTILFMVFGATIFVEVLNYILRYLFANANIEILNFVKILAIEVIFNLLLTIIIYPIIQNFGYYIENEYKGNKILTRYF